MDFRLILVLFVGIVVTRSGASPVSSILNENEDAPEAEDSASVSSYKYEWTENGQKHEEDITIDKKKRTEKIHVNADEESDAADIFHDFELGLTLFRVPEKKACFVSPLDPSEQSPSELARNLEEWKKGTKKPGDEVITRIETNYHDGGSFKNLSSLSEDMRQMCKGYSIDKIEKDGNLVPSGQHGRVKRDRYIVIVVRCSCGRTTVIIIKQSQ